MPVRAGIRTGLLACLISGALLTWLARHNALAASTTAEDAVRRANIWLTLWVSIAAILPSVACGFFGGALATRLLQGNGRLPEIERQLVDGDHFTWSCWVSRAVVAMAWVGLASPLTFLGRPLIIDPPPPPKVLPPQPEPPPPFRYTKRANFESADPSHIIIRARKPFPKMLADRPVAFTSDSRLLAFRPASSRSGRVSAVDLNKLETVATFILPERPDHLPWLPSFTKLVSLTSGQPGSVKILDSHRFSVVNLGANQESWPAGRPCRWWKDEQAVLLSCPLFSLCHSKQAQDLPMWMLRQADQCFHLLHDDRIKGDDESHIPPTLSAHAFLP
jgi:hypothetical protein